MNPTEWIADLIGRADNTGNSFGDHLHLTLKHYGRIIDPTPFIENAAMKQG